MLSLEVRGLLAWVVFSDLAVYKNQNTNQSAFSEKLNPILEAGENTVEVSLGLPMLAGKAEKKPAAVSPSPPEEPEPPAFALKIQRGKQGADPGEQGILVRFEWKSGQTQIPTGRLAMEFRQTFQVSPLPWDAPVWTSVPPLQVDQQAVGALLGGYAEALRARDVDGLMSLNALKFQEMARTLGLKEERMARSFRGYLESLMRAQDWSVSTSTELDYALEGRSRLVRVTTRDGSSPINAVSNGQKIPFDLTVSRIGGKWRTIR